MNEPSENYMGEETLWRAVLLQAVRDYVKPIRTNCLKTLQELRSHKRSASNLLFSQAPSWKAHRRWILMAAGIDPGLTFDELRDQMDQAQTRRPLRLAKKQMPRRRRMSA